MGFHAAFFLSLFSLGRNRLPTPVFLIFLVAQMIKNPPAIWEIWVLSLDWKDPLEESMATHSSILAWRIPMDRGAWRATVHGVTELDMTEQLSMQKPFQIFKNLFLIGG